MYSKDHPFRTCYSSIDAHYVTIFKRNSFQTVANVCGCKAYTTFHFFFIECRWFFKLDLVLFGFAVWTISSFARFF